MKVKINSVKVKIYDTIEANMLDVRVNQDNGTSAVFVYNLSNVPIVDDKSMDNRSTPLGADKFNITADDYAAWVAATPSKGLEYVATYVCNKLGLTITP